MYMTQFNHLVASLLAQVLCLCLIFYAFALMILGRARGHGAASSLLSAITHGLLKLLALGIRKLAFLLYYLVKQLLKGLWWLFLNLRVRRG